MTEATSERLLDPQLLSRLSGMNLIARVVVEGFLLGLHRSPYRGFSQEFSQYRQYMPGDEIRNIDWKVYGRTDRLYIKEFEEETNLFAHPLLDVSHSMVTATGGGISKFDYGRYLAASLAYLLIRQLDAVGLVAFHREIAEYIPAHSGRGHLENILVSLEQLRPGGTTDMGIPLHLVAERIRKRGLVLLVSDLQPFAGQDWETQIDDLVKALSHLRFNGHEVLLFHLLNQAEIELPFEGSIRFVDPETGEELVTVPERVRDSYVEQMGEFLADIERACARYDVEYTRMDTEQPLDYALTVYLATRQKLL